VNTRIEGKFCCKEMFGPVFLMFVTEEMKVLLYFLVFVLDFAISFRMISSSEAGFDTKMFIKSTHESGCKLWTTIGEDFLWNSVEIEDVLIVKISSTLGH
jgi:hypothetical protein